MSLRNTEHLNTLKKVLTSKPEKEDNQMPRNNRVMGSFPMSLSLTGKLSVLFPWAFDLSFTQKVKKVRP